MAAKSKIAAQDFSGWTFQPVDEAGNVQAPAQPASSPGQIIVQDAIPKSLQVTAPAAQSAQPAAPPLPDITTQEPNTYASLHANLARARMANPTVEDYNKVYEESLKESQAYWARISEQLQTQKMELAKSTQLQQSAANIDIAKAKVLEPLEVQKAADIELAKAPLELEKSQLAEGLTSTQALAQYKSAHPDYQGTTAPLIKALPTTELDKATGFINGYKNVSDLHTAFTNMVQNAPGTGGVLRSGILGLVTQPGMTSPQTRTFNSILDSSLVPLARGVFGDTGATAGKEVIQAQMKDALPNASDNEASGGQKVYMLKKRILDNLETQRSVLAGHYDTSMLDAQIAGMHQDLKGIDQFNPLKAPSNVVQSNLSPTANANFNTKIAPPQPAGSPQPAQPTQPVQPTQPAQPAPSAFQGVSQLFGAGTT